MAGTGSCSPLLFGPLLSCLNRVPGFGPAATAELLTHREAPTPLCLQDQAALVTQDLWLIPFPPVLSWPL